MLPNDQTRSEAHGTSSLLPDQTDVMCNIGPATCYPKGGQTRETEPLTCGSDPFSREIVSELRYIPNTQPVCQSHMV